MKIENPRLFFKKKVHIVSTDKKEYTGVVSSYSYAKDNDGKAGFAISDISLWIDEDEIKSIEIID